MFRPTRFRIAVEARIQAKLQYAAKLAYSGVTTRSPVDTGAFRANWNMTLYKPHYEFDKSKTFSESPDFSSIQPFANVWIWNASPYGPALENGHSQQAPVGVLGVTADSVRHAMREY